VGTQTHGTEDDAKASEGDRVLEVSAAKDPTAALRELSSNPDAGTTFNVLGNDPVAEIPEAKAESSGGTALVPDESMGADDGEHGTGAGAGAGAGASDGPAPAAATNADTAAMAALHARVGRGDIGESFVERAKWIPLRLDFEERKKLRLCEAALNVSECVPVDCCCCASLL